LGLLPAVEGDPITLQRLFAYAFRPVMWLIGIPGEDTAAAATLMGTKTVLNAFVAYVDLAHLPPEAMSQRARLIMTYAMCGFANFGSLGILIGGMGGMVPERRAEFVCNGLAFADPQRLVEPGCLFYPPVGVDELAWRRRRHDQRAYSVVGITHTIVSGAVMEVIANWLIAPVQPWYAVICTSKAVRDAVD